MIIKIEGSKNYFENEKDEAFDWKFVILNTLKKYSIRPFEKIIDELERDRLNSIKTISIDSYSDLSNFVSESEKVIKDIQKRIEYLHKIVEKVKTLNILLDIKKVKTFKKEFDKSIKEIKHIVEWNSRLELSIDIEDFPYTYEGMETVEELIEEPNGWVLQNYPRYFEEEMQCVKNIVKLTFDEDEYGKNCFIELR